MDQRFDDVRCILQQFWSPIQLRLDVGGAVNPAALAQRYQGLQTSSKAITDYYQAHRGEEPTQQIQQAARDVLDLTRDDPPSREVAQVREILGKVAEGKPLSQGDLRALRSAVESLEKQILRTELDAASSASTPVETLDQLAELGVSEEVQQAAVAEAYLGKIGEDKRIDPGEIAALRERIKARPGGEEMDYARELLSRAGLSPAAAETMAGYLTAPEDKYRAAFGIGGSAPVTVRLVDGLDGLDLDPLEGYSGVERPKFARTTESLDPMRAPAESVTVTPLTAEETAALEPYYMNADNMNPVPIVAYRVDMEVNGEKKQVTVVYPRDGAEEGRPLPTMDDITRSLRVLPPELLAGVQTVEVNHKRVGTTAGLASPDSGTIHLFPVAAIAKPDTLDEIVIHEASHIWGDRVIEGGLQESKEWQRAVRADGASVSEYADKEHGPGDDSEDLAETMTLYLIGGKDDPEIRAKYSHRFELLAKYYGGNGQR